MKGRRHQVSPSSRLAVAPLLMAVALTAVFSCPAQSAAHDLRVGTRTRLTASATALGTRVSVDGFLRDNVGQGLEGQAIRIDFRDEREPSLQISRDVHTDRTGRFYLSARLAPGRYTALVYYSGREYYYTGDRAKLEAISTALSDLHLVVAAPSLMRSSTEDFALTVAATSEGQPVGDLPIALRVGGDRRRLRTAENGAFTVDIPVVGDSFELAIEARFPGSADFRKATAGAKVRLLTDPQITLEAENVRARLERGVLIEGRAFDRHGPLRGRLVEIVTRQGDGEPTNLQASTDNDGEFSVFVPEDKVEEGKLAIRARLQVPRSEPVESAPLTVDVEKTGLGWTPWLLLLFMASSSLAVALISWRDARRRRPDPARKRRRRRPQRRLQQARSPRMEAIAPSGDAPPATATATSIAGVLWNVQTQLAVAAGQLRVEAASELVAEAVSGEDGSFVFTNLPKGKLSLRVSRKGFVSASHQFRIPHGGDLSLFRFPLTPVRVVVRGLYVDLVEEVISGEAGWGDQTPRQVYRLLLDAVDALVGSEVDDDPPEGLEAFREGLQRILDATRGSTEPATGDQVVTVIVNLVEEVYYSGRDHDEGLVSVTERLTDRVRRSARRLS